MVLDERRNPADDDTQSFYLFERECVEATLSGGGAVAQTGAEKLKTLACTFAAYKAAERNEMVEVAEFYERQIQSGINAGGER